MSPSPPRPDRDVVTAQIGRAPRGTWQVARRCSWGLPLVIAVAPEVDGRPFPTALWLTCPWLGCWIDGLESAGDAAAWTARIASDPALAERMLAADAEYRAFRSRLAPGEDRCGDVGVAGQMDPLVVKCLHARVAAALGGIGDPVGEELLARLDAEGEPGSECADRRCAPEARGAEGLG